MIFVETPDKSSGHICWYKSQSRCTAYYSLPCQKANLMVLKNLTHRSVQDVDVGNHAQSYSRPAQCLSLQACQKRPCYYMHRMYRLSARQRQCCQINLIITSLSAFESWHHYSHIFVMTGSEGIRKYPQLFLLKAYWKQTTCYLLKYTEEEDISFLRYFVFNNSESITNFTYVSEEFLPQNHA